MCVQVLLEAERRKPPGHVACSCHRHRTDRVTGRLAPFRYLFNGLLNLQAPLQRLDQVVNLRSRRVQVA